MSAREDEETAVAARLEQALERIAALAGRPIVLAAPGATSAVTAEVVERLDAVIARLRSALGPDVA